MSENGRIKRLISLIRNDVREIARKDKRHARVLAHLIQSVNLLEAEIFGLGKPNVATEETSNA